MRPDRILLQRLREDRTDLVLLGEEDLDQLDVLLLRLQEEALLERLVRLEDDLAGLRVDDVGGRERALELALVDFDRLDAGLLQRGDVVLGDLLALADRDLGAGDRRSPCAARSPTSDSATPHFTVPPLVCSSSMV